MASIERSIPIDSTISSVSLIPAVSTKFKVIPPKLSLASIKSLVVPDISVTIALSSSSRAFNKLDLPTFGLPTIAVLIPSLINWFLLIDKLNAQFL